MAVIEVEAICISKLNRLSPFERIERVGIRYSNGFTEILSIATAVSLIETGRISMFVRNGFRRVPVRVVYRGLLDPPFLETEADNIWENNLLALPECSDAICVWGA